MPGRENLLEGDVEQLEFNKPKHIMPEKGNLQ